MNLGWEVPGRNIVKAQIKGISINANYKNEIIVDEKNLK